MPPRLLSWLEPNFANVGRCKYAVFQNGFKKLFSVNRWLAHKSRPTTDSKSQVANKAVGMTSRSSGSCIST
jgi:hypothetical protein